MQKPVSECEIYRLGGLSCGDTAELYEDYIVQDDNQIPYDVEKIDRFTWKKNYKLDAFIVPLERHVFLEGASAVDICDVFIEQENLIILQALQFIMKVYSERLGQETDEAVRQGYCDFIDGGKIDEDNLLTVKYFLTNSAE